LVLTNGCAPHVADLRREGWGGRRFGLGVPLEASQVDAPILSRLKVSWYLNWTVYPSIPTLATSNGTPIFLPMVRTKPGGLVPPPDQLREAVRQQPGAMWIIGNEPDNVHQDNLLPAQFAEQYHQAYMLIKGEDPRALVAVGGITVASSLRLAYLDVALAHYRAQYGGDLPADAWTVHHYWLPEFEDGSWLGIPPGSPPQRGLMTNLDEHTNPDRLAESVRRFRGWMRERGYRERPLLLTEFGGAIPGLDSALLPQFMRKSVIWLRTAADPDLGYPEDEYRLVQAWAWFSLRYPPLPVSDLLDEAGRLTPLGEAYRSLSESP
jgi:hypothetical protein